METFAELKVVAEEGDRALLASTERLVPLFWHALFDYEEAQVTRAQGGDGLAARTTVAKARARAKSLLAAVPPGAAAQRAAAMTLQESLQRAPADGAVSLDIEELLAAGDGPAARARIQRTVQLCDLFEQQRHGLPWSELKGRLARLSPALAPLLERAEGGAARAALVGVPGSEEDELEARLVRRGQARGDVKPEALAVGEQGLLLGRFGGVWKLMSSGCSAELRGIWGVGKTAYIVGDRGTVLRLRDGRCRAMDVPVEQHLRAVWGLSERMVCVVGDGGTVLVFTGRSWQPWVMPSEASLCAIGGSGPERICIAGDEPAVLLFDGYQWERHPLPEERGATHLCCLDQSVLVTCRSRWGTELFRLPEGGAKASFVQDPTLPAEVGVSGLWGGWGQSFGLALSGGDVVFFDGQRWLREVVPAERLHGCAAGSQVLCAGESGEYSLILARADGGWRVDGTVKGLRIHAVWAAGQPKPPRLGAGADEEGA